MAKKTFLIAVILLVIAVGASVQEQLDDLTGSNNYVPMKTSLCKCNGIRIIWMLICSKLLQIYKHFLLNENFAKFYEVMIWKISPTIYTICVFSSSSFFFFCFCSSRSLTSTGWLKCIRYNNWIACSPLSFSSLSLHFRLNFITFGSLSTTLRHGSGEKNWHFRVTRSIKSNQILLGYTTESPRLSEMKIMIIFSLQL